MTNVYNFFSSTEDVLAESKGTIDLAWPQNVWSEVEMLKGLAD